MECCKDLKFVPFCLPWTKKGFLSKLFLLLPCIATNKVEIHEETLISIVDNHFDVTWINSHAIKQNFNTPLQIRWYPGFNCCSFHSPRPRYIKKFFFSNMQLFTQSISVLYTGKIVLHYYVRFLQIWSHIQPPSPFTWFTALYLMRFWNSHYMLAVTNCHLIEPSLCPRPALSYNNIVILWLKIVCPCGCEAATLKEEARKLEYWQQSNFMIDIRRHQIQ